MADILYKLNNKNAEYNIATSAYCTCTTAASAVAKVANLHGSSSNTFNNGTIPLGVVIHVKFTYSNTATNPTLNVNNSGAKSIKRYGTTAVGKTVQSSWRAGSIVTFVYDGSYWVMVTGIDSNGDTDTKNTAGALGYNGQTHLIGASEQTNNPVTHTSEGVHMLDGTLRSNMLQVDNEIWFNQGALINASNGILNLTSNDQVVFANGTVNISNNLTMHGEDGATEEWIRNYVANYEPSAQVGSLTVGLETDLYDTSGNFLGEDWHTRETVGEGYYETSVTITPYRDGSSRGTHYLYVDCDYDDPSITCSGGVELSTYSGTGYKRVTFTFPDGGLYWEVCHITVTTEGIEYILVIDFNTNYYQD